MKTMGSNVLIHLPHSELWKTSNIKSEIKIGRDTSQTKMTLPRTQNDI